MTSRDAPKHKATRRTSMLALERNIQNETLAPGPLERVCLGIENIVIQTN